MATQFDSVAVAEYVAPLCGSEVQQSDVIKLVESIHSQPQGDKLLDGISAILKPEPIPSTPRPLESYKRKVQVDCELTPHRPLVTFEMRARDQNREFTSNAAGIVDIRDPEFRGTLYYNEENDLYGEYEIRLDMRLDHVEVHFLRDGDRKMDFVSGRNASSGYAKGSGKWQSM